MDAPSENIPNVPDNPLVCVRAHPMLEVFPAYMKAVTDFNAHASAMMLTLSSVSPEMESAGDEIADALNEYRLAMKAMSFEGVLMTKGNLYGITASHGMDDENLWIFKQWLDIYGLCTLNLARIEQMALASLN